MDIQNVLNNCNNKEIILSAVKENGKLLEYASPELQNDKEVVIEALKQDAEALEFASEELKNDKDIILLGVKRGALDNLLCIRQFKIR